MGSMDCSLVCPLWYPIASLCHKWQAQFKPNICYHWCALALHYVGTVDIHHRSFHDCHGAAAVESDAVVDVAVLPANAAKVMSHPDAFAQCKARLHCIPLHCWQATLICSTPIDNV